MFAIVIDAVYCAVWDNVLCGAKHVNTKVILCMQVELFHVMIISQVYRSHCIVVPMPPSVATHGCMKHALPACRDYPTQDTYDSNKHSKHS
jgi:hypothetical protein